MIRGYDGGALVLTESGHKRIDSLGLSDRIMTQTGEFEKVRGIECKSYTGELVGITGQHNVWSTNLLPSHPVFAKQPEQLPAYIQAKNITTNHFVATLKSLVDYAIIHKYKGQIDGPYVWFQVKFKETVSYSCNVNIYTLENENVYVNNMIL